MNCCRLIIAMGLFLSCRIFGEECANIDDASKKEQTVKNDNDQTCSDAKKTEDREDKQKEKKVEPPKIGNFSLPVSQQPAGLFGFGENIIDQGQVQIFFFADEFVGKNKLTVDLLPNILFGITDNMSIYFGFPYTPIFRDNHGESNGLEDFIVQLEYAFYNKSTSTYTDQATIVGNVTVPTGSTRKDPPTGFGAPSFFIGATYNHMMIDWFVFCAPGAILTTSNHGTKFGNQFLYQFGFGRNIPSPCGWIYAWMIEFDGQYYQKNRFRGRIDPNSGGNVIFATPSLWMSNKNFLIQFGAGVPVTQNWFGDQGRIDYEFNFNIAWTFYP